MKKGKKVIRITSVALGSVLALGTFAVLAGCGGGKKDALVLMTEELNGLFNPFYSTAGTDMDVVGQTQISMLSTDEAGNIAYGDDEPVVVKDYMENTRQQSGKTYTDYTFVLKNGIVFSDNIPLTMNDVMFNLYEYLDPAYTGSTTMYSTKIQGLQEYRLQNLSNSTTEDEITTRAINRANARLGFLTDVYMKVGQTKAPTATEAGSYYLEPEAMRTAINTLADGNKYGLLWSTYINATWANGKKDGKPVTVEEAREQLLADYNKVVGSAGDKKDGLFWEELERDYQSAQATYAEAPYTNQEGKPETNHSGVDFTKDEVLCFMAMEGLVEIKYTKVNGRDDYNQIESVTPQYDTDTIKTKEQALEHVYNYYVPSQFHSILMGWASGQELYDEFTANAKAIVMREGVGENGLIYKNISGIKSLGHVQGGPDSVTIGSKTYTVAKEHDEFGAPAQSNTYDVLQITVEGTDPKAIWNFGFTVAPWHYYSDPSQTDLQVDIANNKFGVRWSDFDFQRDVIQGRAKTYTPPKGSAINYGNVIKTGVPLGAGPYVATNSHNDDYPSYGGFISNNIVYYKANKHFFENVEDKSDDLHAPYIEKMRYQVVSSANAIAAIKSGSVDYVEPQLTNENYEALTNMKGVKEVDTWQLGYGYIGVNAKYITSLSGRRAIMAAMDTTLATNYYREGTVATIYWPMSLVSWAYPRTAGNKLDPSDYRLNKEDNNGKDYAKAMSETRRVELIKKYTEAAKKEGMTNFKVTFTIAGSSLTEHPCYTVFQNAQKLLNENGWNVTVQPDTQALTKLATGSLQVWAAAWGSTIDPDMYQVYHKNSTATSVLAWGYPHLIANGTTTEQGYLNNLAKLIDKGRTSLDQTERAQTYKEAMGYVLDLAIELPVYQRKTMHGININVIDESTLPTNINPYNSPLSRIWEIKMK